MEKLIGFHNDEISKFNSRSSNDEFLEEKNHFKTPKVENVDIRIFLDRLVGIFNSTMTKLEFATALPWILSHPRVIEVLSKEHYKQVALAFAPRFCFREIDEETTSSSSSTLEEHRDGWSSSNESTANSEKSDVSSDSPKMNIDVFNALEILSSYPLIRQVAEQNRDLPSKSAQSFLRQLQYFMEFVVSKTKHTSFEERQKEIHLREIVDEIERTNNEISHLAVSLEDQKARHSRESGEFVNRWKELSNKWSKINEEFEEECLKIAQNSEDDSNMSRETFDREIIELQASLERAQESLERQKAKSQKIEGDVQGKKFKVESQLLAVLNKYDTEIGERQAAYEELENQYADLENEKSELMEEMGEQLRFYEQIITEREEKEFAVFRERFDKFVNNRCARIIQRWWRGILKKRKKDKKKKKKGKKK